MTPTEVEDSGPKIVQVIDWFDQLQGVNLENVEPAIRAYTGKLSNLRPDEPIIYKDRYNKIWTLQLKPIEMSLLPVEILKIILQGTPCY